MISLRKLTAGAVAAAVLFTSATPALARHRYNGYENGYGNGYGWGHRHRHRDRVDAGDVVAGVVVVGILAAILSSSAKKKREREAGRDGYPAQRGNITSEDAAVDACVNATETQFGDRASVRDITQVDRNADGWDVEGVVQKRIDWRDSRNAEQRRFTCSVRYGAVDNVYIDTDTLALN
mgnify:CR=1 FL=1